MNKKIENVETVLKRAERVAVAAAKKSGAMLVREFARFDRSQINRKQNNETVTKWDLASERLLINEIRRAFPEHVFLSEESGSDGQTAPFRWIIDPIDGTTNFTIHNPLWSISIGLAYNDELIFGLIYIPYLKEMYTARHLHGAFCNNKKISPSIIVGQSANHAFCHGKTDQAILLATKYIKVQKTSHVDCRQLGSAAAELAYVACGRMESMVMFGVNAWDVAGGALLVREAGGRVVNELGQPWRLADKTLIATNGLVEADILRVIKKL
jgi:myo-inositol-1(or 4)-monophosphatase